MTVWRGFILAFIGGFVDTTTFIGAHGVFSAHVTGNFVLFAMAIFQGAKEIDFLKIFLFIPFLVSVGLVGWINRKGFFGKKYESSALFMASLFLFAPGIYFLFGKKPDENLWGITSLFVMFPVIAMGIQNGVGKIVSPLAPMTTVMTGNVIQLALEFIGYESNSTNDQSYHRQKAASFLRVIAGFAVGCLSAAWMVTNFSMGALLVPAIVLSALAIYKWLDNVNEES